VNILGTNLTAQTTQVFRYHLKLCWNSRSSQKFARN